MIEPNPDGDCFVFEKTSAIWRVNCHACGLIYGPAAAILQVAHPRIAQGVADHSDFRNDALGRLQRTLSSVNRIAFGTLAEARAMQTKLAHIHGTVRGSTSDGMPGPKNYSAFEPDLLLWVLATLIDASVQGYQAIWGPLPLDQRNLFYADMRKFGTYFGLSADFGPTNWEEFETYFQSELMREDMAAHPLCTEVAQGVVYPQVPEAARLLGLASNFIPIETLPTHIRTRLDLRSTSWTKFRWKFFQKLAPIAFRILPKRLTYYPEAYARR